MKNPNNRSIIFDFTTRLNIKRLEQITKNKTALQRILVHYPKTIWNAFEIIDDLIIYEIKSTQILINNPFWNYTSQERKYYPLFFSELRDIFEKSLTQGIIAITSNAVRTPEGLKPSQSLLLDPYFENYILLEKIKHKFLATLFFQDFKQKILLFEIKNSGIKIIKELEH